MLSYIDHWLSIYSLVWLFCTIQQIILIIKQYWIMRGNKQLISCCRLALAYTIIVLMRSNAICIGEVMQFHDSAVVLEGLPHRKKLCQMWKLIIKSPDKFRPIFWRLAFLHDNIWLVIKCPVYLENRKDDTVITFLALCYKPDGQSIIYVLVTPYKNYVKWRGTYQ